MIYSTSMIKKSIIKKIIILMKQDSKF
ncbi:hypothetical protein, partial [Plasmodium yoelii yoelii]